MDWRSKLAARITDFVIQIASGFHLKARQHRDNFAIGLDHLRGNVLAVRFFDRNSNSVVSPRSSSR